MPKPDGKPRITVTKNGPYLVTGGVPLAKQTIVTDGEGGSQEWREGEAVPREENYELCRCGHSNTKPFCDGSHRVSGPYWVRGGIPVVAADGFAYEVRNRMTLCRCGASSNKPFCDGSHVTVKFRDSG
jgi:CDGSH-type Zn-finger protein